MMIVPGLLLAEICLISAGLGAALWLLPKRPTSRLEMAGVTLMFGPGVVSLLLFGLSWMLRGAGLVATVALLSLALGASGLLRARRTISLGALPGSRGFLFALLPLLAIVAWQAVNHPLYSDGLVNFEMRAQLAVQHGGHVPASFYSDASRAWVHPDYPLFLPMTQAWVYVCLRGAHQGLMMLLLSAHFLAAAACLLYAGVARITSESWRAGLAVTLLITLPAAMTAPGGAASVWGDFPLATVFLGAILCIVELAATGGALGWLAGFLALLPWVKREGTVLAAILVLVAAWAAWRQGRLRSLALALVPLVISVLGWKAFLAGVHVNASRDFLPVTPSHFLEHSDRLPFILIALIRELLAWERWSVLWILTVPALVAIARQSALKQWRLLGWFIGPALVIYTGVYIFSAWSSLPLHVMTSLPRLLLPLAMPAILAIAVAVPRVRAAAGDRSAVIGNR